MIINMSLLGSDLVSSFGQILVRGRNLSASICQVGGDGQRVCAEDRWNGRPGPLSVWFGRGGVDLGPALDAAAGYERRRPLVWCVVEFSTESLTHYDQLVRLLCLASASTATLSLVEQFSYWGYLIEHEPGREGPHLRKAGHWYYVSDGDAHVFTVHATITWEYAQHRGLSDRLPAQVEDLGRKVTLGRLSLAQFDPGGGHEEVFDSKRAAPGQMTDDEVELAVLRSLRRMQRKQQGDAEIHGLDVSGVAFVLGTTVEYLQGILSELLTLGQTEAHAETMGHQAVDGALRITSSGLARVRGAAESFRPNLTQALWGELQDLLEPALRDVGLDDHLANIEQGLRLENRAGWQSAMFGCRSLISGLADYVWQDPRPAYTKLPGTRDGKLDVTLGKYVNRIGAFINERVPSKSVGDFLRAEAERTWTSLDQLTDVASKGHDPEVTREDASLVVISTYTLLGELIRRTGLSPVVVYEP